MLPSKLEMSEMSDDAPEMMDVERAECGVPGSFATEAQQDGWRASTRSVGGVAPFDMLRALGRRTMGK